VAQRRDNFETLRTDGPVSCATWSWRTTALSRSAGRLPESSGRRRLVPHHVTFARSALARPGAPGRRSRLFPGYLAAHPHRL